MPQDMTREEMIQYFMKEYGVLQIIAEEMYKRLYENGKFYPVRKNMAILDTIHTFLVSHEALLKEIEAMTIPEAIALLKELFPENQVLMDVITKIAADIEKIQGIQPQ